ncbi:glutaminyl-peptide cyclotransferase [Corynebacterium appendicis]|uniref:glutaminyl-peptide cyclotransferase n=1 Tax=Corynebacterium appendicis TaxID=163202 RepID=UPI00254A607A|nr:glutaminyl-peptide cyclotransferase [Corynebacterium appendicis]MDK8625743.1 glutaminyl-peptide cyclotransferase [Corynebacterium appendicis]
MVELPHAAALSSLLTAVALLAVGCSSTAAQHESAGTEMLTVSVKETLPFDDTSFTQGLEVAPDGTLYVATGMEGESRIYRTSAQGEELASEDLEPDFFGEGITRVGDHLWQLTWQNNTAIKRDADTLAELERTSFDGEGWGLCHRQDANEVIFSDGTAELRRMDPDTLTERERFTVTRGGQPLEGINELECVGDDIYANIFTTTDIVRIDAETGSVEALIDASAVPNNASPDPNHVLNGIAFIPDSGNEFYLTGKRWPDMYRVTFEPK